MKNGVFFLLSVFFLACSNKGYETYTTNNVSLDSIYNSTELESIIAPYRDAVNAEMNEVIGSSDSLLVKYAPESPLSNFAADVVFQKGIQFEANGFEGMNAKNTFSMLNFGGLRAPINKGEITVGNVYELMPFDNTIVLLALTPAELKELMDYLCEVNGQPVGNASFILKKNNYELFIGEEAFDLSQPVYVITSNYLASGGDKMNFFKTSAKKWDSGVLLRDVFIEYIRKKNRLKCPGLSNRIEIIE